MALVEVILSENMSLVFVVLQSKMVVFGVALCFVKNNAISFQYIFTKQGQKSMPMRSSNEFKSYISVYRHFSLTLEAFSTQFIRLT